jgi:hypothetical protein
MIEIQLTLEQRNQWLYYETGFEQLNPYPDIIDWMGEQGWRYRHDWNCIKRGGIGYTYFSPQSDYFLQFNDEAMASAFLLKWV